MMAFRKLAFAEWMLQWVNRHCSSIVDKIGEKHDNLQERKQSHALYSVYWNSSGWWEEWTDEEVRGRQKETARNCLHFYSASHK